MNVLRTIRQRFAGVLQELVADPAPLLELIRPAQDAKFGDYQANCAMPLGKQLGQPPRAIAEQLIRGLQLDDICHPPEIAGPGFINLRVRDEWLAGQLLRAVGDERLGVEPASPGRTFVVDYSSPNVAKPMHVGHIRSTVIGDALYRTLSFLGHRVVSDNHLGDWGTQFGMIIYGFKNFLDQDAYARRPVEELGRLYKLVNQLVEYHEFKLRRPQFAQQLEKMAGQLEELAARHGTLTGAEQKKAAKDRDRLATKLREGREELERLDGKLAAIEQHPEKRRWAAEHPQIGAQVLEETAKLHAGDAENRGLWAEFLPGCRLEIQKVYLRLGVRFDFELGESFYHDMLPKVVQELEARGLAVTSEGATCVFLEGFDAPMIVRKSDGAFLYATTDLATIQYRMATWHPDVVLYVVDIRQSDHFGKLFAAAKKWGYDSVDLQHISFGTVLGEDGKPYKTREGEAVSLEALLDEAVARAYHVVCSQDDKKDGGGELSDDERRRVAEVVGHGAVKYRDLSHNRTSDYVFSFDKMLELDGNTSAYLQYAYARVQNIFAKGEVARDELRQQAADPAFPPPVFLTPEERHLAMGLLRFHETLEEVLVDYRPNILTSYLYELSQQFSKFYTNPQCKVLKAETPLLRNHRLLLCDLAGRTLGRGLGLLGIQVVDKM